MYAPIALIHRPIAEYHRFVGEETFAELYALAQPLRGFRVLNLTYTGMSHRGRERQAH